MTKSEAGNRKERLAAALRANLKRRKARDRRLAKGEPVAPADPGRKRTPGTAGPR